MNDATEEGIRNKSAPSAERPRWRVIPVNTATLKRTGATIALAGVGDVWKVDDRVKQRKLREGKKITESVAR